MKTLLAILAMTALLMTSCTKELPSLPQKINDIKKMRLVKGSFDSQRDIDQAFLSNGTTEKSGHWGYEDHFADSLASDVQMSFAEEDDNQDFVGTVQFAVHLSGSKLTDYTYSGTGTWYIVESTGTLSTFIKSGAGTLTYKLINYPPDEDGTSYPEYQMEMEGYGK